MRKWIDDELLKVITWEEAKEQEAFTLEQLQAAFFLLALGCLLASLAFLLERLCCPFTIT